MEERIKELEARVKELEDFQLQIIKTLELVSTNINDLTKSDELILKCFKKNEQLIRFKSLDQFG